MKYREDGKQVVGAVTKIIEAAYTRPANTTQYAAGDQISDSASSPSPLTFSGVGVQMNMPDDFASGVILDAVCIDSANQATKPDFELYLFDTEPTANNDNAAWSPTDADMLNCIGVIAFAQADWKEGNPTAGAGGNAINHQTNVDLAFECEGDIRDLYGLVVERGTYTPVSGEIFTFRLKILQD